MMQRLFEKLQILGYGAKYDVACTSSGVQRRTHDGIIGSAERCGLCHSFAGDGRCISLLKVLMSNACAYDCRYCVNRRSGDFRRETFTPGELAALTIEFYRRNYIEGLFLSSAVIGTPDYTAELMIETLRLLRTEYGFTGYIHAKAIPGTSPELLERLGMLADRMSVNIELPTSESLSLLCPEKTRESVLAPMAQIRDRKAENTREIAVYKNAPRFVPAGQSTQMIIGASPETDFQILRLTESLYGHYSLKRVFFSAYIPMMEDSALPALDSKPPLLREHRLYQADWLLRFYGFHANEILDEEHPNFHPNLDPKSNWAVQHYGVFPFDVNTASREELLRVPGMGVKSVARILTARQQGRLGFADLPQLGVVMKRARYFLTCSGRRAPNIHADDPQEVLLALMSVKDARRFRQAASGSAGRQLSLFDETVPVEDDIVKSITGQL